jgi:hypothetical protein
MAFIRASGEAVFVVYDSKITAMNMPAGQVYRYVHFKTETSRDAAEMLAPKRTGSLAGGIRIDVRQTSRDRVVGRVRSTRHYSRWVHEGTGPFIFPNDGDYLSLPAFRGAPPGRRIKRPFVHGQDANPFLANALAIGLATTYPTPIGPVNPFV